MCCKFLHTGGCCILTNMQATRLISQLGTQRFSGRRVQQPVTKLTPAARRTPFLAWFFLASSVGSVGSVGSDYRALCSVGLHRRRPPWRQVVLLGAPLAISISLSDSSRCSLYCNFLIAASRIGLRCGCVGHLCDDRYEAFLRKILAD